MTSAFRKIVQMCGDVHTTAQGERIPPLDIVKKFTEYYGVTIDYIAKLSDVSTTIRRQ